MRQVFAIHNTDVIIYKESEKDLFVDDNKAETVIFIDDKGNKILKRFIIKDEGEKLEKILEISFDNQKILSAKKDMFSLEK